MRAIFLGLLLVVGCENRVPVTLDAPPSVKWNHSEQSFGAEPICFDAKVTRGDATHILCEWDCLMFWTNLRGVGRYYVSREWILTDGQWVSAQFFPWPENVNEQSWECDG